MFEVDLLRIFYNINKKTLMFWKKKYVTYEAYFNQTPAL
jgi:hypothetical protein